MNGYATDVCVGVEPSEGKATGEDNWNKGVGNCGTGIHCIIGYVGTSPFKLKMGTVEPGNATYENCCGADGHREGGCDCGSGGTNDVTDTGEVALCDFCALSVCMSMSAVGDSGSLVDIFAVAIADCVSDM
jgi:hypothetical protein